MAINVGATTAGGIDSFSKFSLSRFAVKHLFVVESKIDGAELPSLFVLRGLFPYNEIQTFPIERGNSNTYYPELVDVNDLEIEFYETMDNLVWNFFYDWSKLIFAKNEKDDVVFNLPNKFKKNIYVFRLDTMAKEGENELTRVFGYEYSGCFPKRISDYPLDMSDPNALTLSITFSADNVKRLTKGMGISDPKINDRSSSQLTSNPVTGQKRTGLASKVEADSKWRELEVKLRTEATADRAKYELRKNTVDVGLWVAALLKAAARTGINIAEREAYYMAHAAARKANLGREFNVVAGGVRNGIDFTKSL